MAREKTIIKQTNNIVYVEPNYTFSTNQYDSTGLQTYEFIPDLEDYSIFVNLEIETIGRTIQTGNKVYKFSYVSRGGEESINLMGGTKIYTADGNSINSLTTDYTNYHITDLKSSNGASPELFGINYIDIAYNHFMVPEVTIEFVDVRGASVFGQRELYESNEVEKSIGGNHYDPDIVNTFFQCFFTFPYPKFNLLVKGFYGQPVAYELTCADFRAKFNSDTGNFSCTAKFVGYYFSFLNDVMLNAIIAAPYSDFEGSKYWKERGFKLPGYNGGEIDLPKIGQLLKIIKDAETAAEHLSQSSPEVQEKNNIEQVTQKLNTVKSYYESYVNTIIGLVKTKKLEDGLQLFITDMNDDKISSGAIILVETDTKHETTFKEYTNADERITDAFNALNTEINSIKDEYPSVGLEPLKHNFADETPHTRIFQNEKNRATFVVDNGLGANKDLKEQNKNLYDTFETLVLRENKDSTVNKYSGYTKAYYYYDEGFAEKLNSILKENSEKVKDVSEKLDDIKNDALAKRLGFKPSVENVTKIVMAHFETFANMIYKTALYINNESPKRDTKKIGITDDNDISDVPELYRSSDTNTLLVPPFPKVTKIVEQDGIKNREETWVGDYGNMFREVDLVHGILNGIEEFVKEANSGENTGAAGSTSSVGAVMKYPLSTLDFILTDNVYSDFDQNEVSSLLGLVGLRALQIIGTPNFDDWDDNCEVLGRAEAENLLSTDKLSDEFKKKLSGVLDSGVDNVIEMLKGNPTGIIPKPTGDIWPWQNSTESVGIITSNGEFNICKIPGVSDKVLYTLPLQNLSWKTIKEDVLWESHKAAFKEDYFNISKSEMRNIHKDNIFNVETNINRIKNICENQMKGIDGIEEYRDKILKEATYDESKYKDLFEHGESLVAHQIKDAANILPANNSKMIPSTISYMKQMSWGGGYDMDDFIKVDMGGGWTDVNGNTVVRNGENGFKDFLKDINTSTYTITEIPGLYTNLDPFEDVSLFTQKLYYLQTDDRVKAFMFLCSLAYLYDYNEILEDHICEDDETISIIPLPAVIYAGGLLWSLKEENRSLFKGGIQFNGIKYVKYSVLLKKLNPQVQTKLIKTFEQWINKGVQNNSIIVSFKEIKNNMELTLKRKDMTFEKFFDGLGEIEDESWFFGIRRSWFKEGVFESQKYNGVLDLFAGEFGESFFRNFICVDEDLKGSKKFSQNTVGMRVGNRDGSVGVMQIVDFALAPCLFIKNSKFFFNDVDSVLKVDTGNLNSFFKGFLERIKEEVSDTAVDNSVSQAKETNTTTDIKVGVYRYCKLLYDKWIGGMSETDMKQYTMESFFETDDRYFYFIDAYYNYAEEVPINIGRFCDMIKESYANADYSLLSFLSSVYSENKFNFLCVQNFINLAKRDNMINMFDCIPYTEHWDVKKHPNFIVNYAYEASSHLEMENSEYENDGFMINMPNGNGNKWPEALKSRDAGATPGLNIPAFGVSYGKMYQSYFKDISVSMDNPTVTEQSIKAQFAIASMHNENKTDNEAEEYTYGQDLYSVYSNNSYECDVTMMGCAWVQPLMLFVLNNVPMFRGTYQIINVTHHIEQGTMTTKFKGVRMANVTTRIVKDYSAKKKSDQSNEGENTYENKQSSKYTSMATTDNDCPYQEFPLSVNGTAGGGIPESFLNMKFVEFCGGNPGKYNQGNGYGSSWLTESDRTIGEVLCAAIGAEYRGFTQNNSLMLRVASAMVCNKYHWCKANEKWVYLFGTKQQGTGNRAATESTYNKVKDIVMPVFKNGPGSLVGETAKVQSGCNVEIWNRGKTEHKKAPNTHVITEDDMRRVFAYCTMGGYDYEHIGRDSSKVGNQTAFENKSVPNNGKSQWKQADFLFQEYNSVFTSNPTTPSKTYWEPAPTITNNGDGKVSDLANGFLHALNQTSSSSAVGVKIGIDKEKSNGDTIYLTNGNDSSDFGKVLDIMLQAYSSKIEEIRWIVPEGGNQSPPPVAYIVSLKEGSNYTLVKVVDESDKLINAISISNEGGINSDFKKSIVKKYKDETNRENKVCKYVLPAMSSKDAKKLFEDVKITPCGSDNQGDTSGGDNGPYNTSAWDVDAFVKNLHYWQKNICENKGRTRERYGGCHLCTSVINRALEATGFGKKYWGGEPWDVRDKLKATNSDFKIVDKGIFNEKDKEFPFVDAPQKGDICTFWAEGNKGKRHTCAFDGSKWVSDYVQSKCRLYNSMTGINWCRFRHK